MIGKLKKEINVIGYCKNSSWGEDMSDLIFTDGEEIGELPKFQDDKKLFYPLPVYNLFNVFVTEDFIDI
jgi:hypothetical protein